jgi:hypothetical protein
MDQVKGSPNQTALEVLQEMVNKILPVGALPGFWKRWAGLSSSVFEQGVWRRALLM